MNKILFFFAFLFFQFGFSQQIEFLKIKKFEVAVFSDTLRENSGLTFFNENLYAINDSGNSSEIFEINKENANIKNIVPTQLVNVDWEAITSDSTHFYIGDFGNNSGVRKDLKVYKLSYDSIKNIQEIPYYYPEQKDFTPKNLNNNFDAEAMIYLDGKIHVFTKEWVAKATSNYTINPEVSQIQAAKKTETFPTGFVVTDASYFDKKLYLVGYTKNTEVFLSIFNETKSGIFFEQKPKKYYLGSAFSIGQIEGIAVNKSGVYISGEKFVTPIGSSKPRLYFIPHENFK